MDKEYGKTIEIPMRGFTHGSKFHSDDVFATAFLKILNPDIEITRGVPMLHSGLYGVNLALHILVKRKQQGLTGILYSLWMNLTIQAKAIHLPPL